MFARLAVILVLFASTSALASPEAGPALERREVCGTGSVLNRRAGPTTNAKILDRLPDEFHLTVLGSSMTGSWLRVRDDGGRTGWVSRQFTCADDGADTVVAAWQDPAPGRCISSPFGPRKRPCRGCSKNHRGADIAVCNEPVKSAASGRVITARYDKKGGNFVAVDHGGGLVSYYMHLKKCEVSAGAPIAAGARVGLAGKTGSSTTGCHLHFEIRKNGLSVDPETLVALTRKPPNG